jgi:hypothetical protein
LRHEVRIGLLQLKRAAFERGGAWRWAFEIFRVVFVAFGIYSIVGLLASAVRFFIALGS